MIGALAVGALGYGASITLWVRGAHHLGAARGQVIFAAPFLGALVSWVVLTDPVEPLQVAAMAIALCGITLSLRSSHLHDHEHDPSCTSTTTTTPTGTTTIPTMRPSPRATATFTCTVRWCRHAHPHVPDLHHRHDH